MSTNKQVSMPIFPEHDKEEVKNTPLGLSLIILCFLGEFYGFLLNTLGLLYFNRHIYDCGCVKVCMIDTLTHCEPWPFCEGIT
jgi:hypothetical protein